MSKVYKCDGCEVMIEKPHDVKMKEFYFIYNFVRIPPKNFL